MTQAAARASDVRIRQVLRKLHGHAGWQRLFGARAPALFRPKSAAVQELVNSAVERGLIEVDEAGNNARARITDAGREWLLGNEDPRVLLEDLLRVTEAQAESLRKLEGACNELRWQVQRQNADVSAVLGLLSAEMRRRQARDEVVERLASRADWIGPATSLADLYRDLRRQIPTLTIGEFHDVVRRLVESDEIRLSPWTGALYQLPEPELALLIGHEVLYYVHHTAKLAV